MEAKTSCPFAAGDRVKNPSSSKPNRIGSVLASSWGCIEGYWDPTWRVTIRWDDGFVSTEPVKSLSRAGLFHS